MFVRYDFISVNRHPLKPQNSNFFIIILLSTVSKAAVRSVDTMIPSLFLSRFRLAASSMVALAVAVEWFLLPSCCSSPKMLFSFIVTEISD